MVRADYARFLTVQNSQFFIHIRFANRHIRRFNIRVNSLFFFTKSKDTNHHKSRIVWHHNRW